MAARIKETGKTVKIWASRDDTYWWAHNNWPCSTIKDKSIFAEYYNGDLVDLLVNGKYGADIDGHELNAFIDDITRGRGYGLNL